MRKKGLYFLPRSGKLLPMTEPGLLPQGPNSYIWRETNMSEIKKIVLAYSGGLDTSIIIP